MYSRLQKLFGRMYGTNDETLEGIKEVIFFGSMVGSAIVSPVLGDTPLVWRLDIFIFIISSGGFALRHREDINKYGPLMVLATTLLGLLAYASARTPLRELVPWIPIALLLLLLLTTYSLPRLWPRLNNYAPVDQEGALEEGLSQLAHGSAVETGGSVQTRESRENRDEFPLALVTHCCAQNFQEHQISHMSRSASRLSRFSSAHGSDIDLEPASYQMKRWVSPSRAGVFMNVARAFEDHEYPPMGLPVGSTWPCAHCRSTDERSCSPDSQRADYSPTSARSGSPLLEQDQLANLMDP